MATQIVQLSKSLQQADDQELDELDRELEAYVSCDATTQRALERAAERIRLIMVGLARKLGYGGRVETFGSFTNGFKTGGSDVDIVFIGDDVKDKDGAVNMFIDFAARVPSLGFENVTTIYSSQVPLLKFTDMRTSVEVDFCINNTLGYWNSRMLQAYCRCDARVRKLGCLVKDWAKTHELAGTADGCLNSYAYILLVIYFLQKVQPPVLPNLQAMVSEPRLIKDHKWGTEEQWDAKFFDDLESIPRSENTMGLQELLFGFFETFIDFDWKRHAVCSRLVEPDVDGHTEKTNPALVLSAADDQWYIEDPFDLKHNLARNCSRKGRFRILEQMRDTMSILKNGGPWAQACPPYDPDGYFLKCRVTQNLSPQDLLEAFEEYDLQKLYFPKSENAYPRAQAFLEFPTAQARRRAHTKNETPLNDTQLQLVYSTQQGLADVASQMSYFTYEMAVYKAQRQRLKFGSSGDDSAYVEGTMRNRPMPDGPPPPGPHMQPGPLSPPISPMPLPAGRGAAIPPHAVRGAMAPPDRNGGPPGFGGAQDWTHPHPPRSFMAPQPLYPQDMPPGPHMNEQGLSGLRHIMPPQPGQQHQQPQPRSAAGAQPPSWQQQQQQPGPGSVSFGNMPKAAGPPGSPTGKQPYPIEEYPVGEARRDRRLPENAHMAGRPSRMQAEQMEQPLDVHQLSPPGGPHGRSTANAANATAASPSPDLAAIPAPRFAFGSAAGLPRDADEDSGAKNKDSRSGATSLPRPGIKLTQSISPEMSLSDKLRALLDKLAEPSSQGQDQIAAQVRREDTRGVYGEVKLSLDLMEQSGPAGLFLDAAAMVQLIDVVRSIDRDGAESFSL
eukprot:TRINITY_DN80052_c0_g1_i1.p1 TRINITY_DN80052_c0_g1~~TRINITY_DN80052_c0_g1_i1.p1  ORF type:complete len:838 (-),score=136.68 TRINITY_DN80052_c0_g1_i1:114-2627(-)